MNWFLSLETTAPDGHSRLVLPVGPGVDTGFRIGTTPQSHIKLAPVPFSHPLPDPLACIVISQSDNKHVMTLAPTLLDPRLNAHFYLGLDALLPGHPLPFSAESEFDFSFRIGLHHEHVLRGRLLFYPPDGGSKDQQLNLGYSFPLDYTNDTPIASIGNISLRLGNADCLREDIFSNDELLMMSLNAFLLPFTPTIAMLDTHIVASMLEDIHVNGLAPFGGRLPSVARRFWNSGRHVPDPAVSRYLLLVQNVGHFHWRVIVLDWFKSRVNVLDSMFVSSEDEKNICDLTDYIIREMKKKYGCINCSNDWIYHPVEVPRQLDGWSCGFHVLRNTIALVMGEDFSRISAKEASSSSFRQRRFAEILERSEEPHYVPHVTDSELFKLMFMGPAERILYDARHVQSTLALVRQKQQRDEGKQGRVEIVTALEWLRFAGNDQQREDIATTHSMEPDTEPEHADPMQLDPVPVHAIVVVEKKAEVNPPAPRIKRKYTRRPKLPRPTALLKSSTASSRRQFVCFECGQKFARSTGLSRHRTSLHLRRGRDIPCGLCSSVFSRKEHMKRHVREIHLGEKARKR
jgi:DNA-directed RNA polymerase subunit RPC12/RpoP